MGRPRSVSLNLRGADPQQSCGFPRMRRDHAILRQNHTFLGEQVQRIGVPDLRQRRVGGGGQKAAAPRSLTETGPDDQYGNFLKQSHQLIG
ncbi:hypothetical protein D3C86_1855130 [compost metagenome]